jgi:Ca2+-binding EF-hand superfamily protein
MQSLGFESKNPTIFNMISDLESLGREVDFEEFLDGITSKLGDKDSRVFDLLYRTASTKSSTSLMMITLDSLNQPTFEELPSNLEKQ